MRKLIRNKATKAFLRNEGEWTTDPKLAQHFRDAPAAHKAADFLKLANVELYYLIEENPSDYDFTIPLSSLRNPATPPQNQRT